MSAAAEGPEPDGVWAPGGTFFAVTERDDEGRVIALTPLHDVEVVRSVDGDVLGLSVGCHPSRGRLRARDVLFRPTTVELDTAAALGDQHAARLSRWRAIHPGGPTTAEEQVEHDALLSAVEATP